MTNPAAATPPARTNFFELSASLEGPPHAEGCACQPCLQKVTTLLARISRGLLDLVEAWGLEDHDDRN